ncbi:MAG: MFS transporter [Spirochaetes bacterium]|nr:MAG: MFS transporter [Spirochaetota bacterium]
MSNKGGVADTAPGQGARAGAAVTGPGGNFRWVICALLFFAASINYLDRQVFGILKPLLKTDLRIGESEYGYIVMAFQFAYAAGMLLSGRIIDAIGTKISFALFLFLWSLASMLHAAAGGALGFGVARAFLGVSEAGNFPAAIKTVAEWFPKKERALATGIFNSGTNIGAILAPVLVPWLAGSFGWQAAFVATGAVGLMWLIFWFRYYDSPERSARLSPAELRFIRGDREESAGAPLSWAGLFRYRQTWAFVAAKFLTDPIWWFFLFWIPGWLADVRGMDLKSFGLPLVVIYTATTVGSVFGGWLSSFMIARGMPAHRSRNRTMLLFALLVVPIVFVQSHGMGLPAAIALVSLAAASHQAWSANLYTTVSDMFPAKAVASVTGIGGMAGALGGMLIAALAGNVLQYWEAQGDIRTGYFALFLVSGSAYLLAWCMFNVLAPGMKRVRTLE